MKMSMIMEKEIEYAKYLGVKVFSNKWYSIHVMLFDQGMARARIRYKRERTKGNSGDGGVMEDRVLWWMYNK